MTTGTLTFFCGKMGAGKTTLSRSIFSEIAAPHTLVVIEQPDSVCLERIARRRSEQPERAATDTVAMFEAVTRLFVAPTPDEGFDCVWQ